MKERDTYFDVLKGYAILLVILGHAIHYINVENWQSDYVSNVILMFHMPLFIAISGYFLFPSITKDNFFEYTKKKFFPLILPSITITIFYYIEHAIVELIKHGSYSLEPIGISEYTGFWYLTVLFYLSVSSKFLLVLHGGGKVWLSIMLSIALLILYFIPDLYMMMQIRFLLPFFILGIVFNGFDWKKCSLSLFLVSLLIFIVCSLYYTFEYSMYTLQMGCDNYNLISLFRFTAALCGCIVSIYICKILHKSKFITKILSYIGKITLPLYVIHYTLFVFIYKFHLSSSNHYVVYLSFLIVTIVSILLYKMINKNKMLALALFGKR